MQWSLKNRGIKSLLGIQLLVLSASVSALANFAAQAAEDTLNYTPQTRSVVPIPPAEAGLQTVEATPWFKYSNDDHILEGISFAQDGSLVFCDVSQSKVMRVSPDKKLSTVVTLPYPPAGTAFAPNGQLYIAAQNFDKGIGGIFTVDPTTHQLAEVIAPELGYQPDDLVFDHQGGFYFSDFAGTSTDRRGGIYYYPASHQGVQPVMRNMAKANGVALSPDDKVLWATETGRNLLYRSELSQPAEVSITGTSTPYYFTGPAPDSMRVDVDGNVYVAMFHQARVLVFNSQGIPIGQILLPNRATGHNLYSSSIAIKPNARDLYIVADDAGGDQGAVIYHARAFANGLPLLATK